MNGNEQHPGGNGGRRGPSGTVLAVLIVAVIAVIFVLQNRERIQIDFLFFELSSRTWVLIAISMVLGVVLGNLVPRVVRGRRRRSSDQA